MKNYSAITKIQLATLGILFSVLLISCGKTTSESTTTSKTIDNGGISETHETPDTSVTKTVGAFSIKTDRATASANSKITFTITPPNTTDNFGYSLNTTSNASVNLNGGITAGSGTISIGSGSNTGVQTFILKGAASGQVINVMVGITGYTDKATFQITIR